MGGGDWAEVTARAAAEGQDDVMIINMGPQHPSTHGVLRLVVELKGEEVISLQPVVVSPMSRDSSSAAAMPHLSKRKLRANRLAAGAEGQLEERVACARPPIVSMFCNCMLGVGRECACVSWRAAWKNRPPA